MRFAGGILIAGCAGVWMGGCSKQASTLTHPPKHASFPLFVTIPGNEPGSGKLIKVLEPEDIDTPSETVELLTGLDYPAGVTVDEAGVVYFTERPTPTTGRIRKLLGEDLAPETVFEDLADPQGLAVDSIGRLYVAESGAGELSVVHLDGSMEPILTGLSMPRGLTTDVEDNIFVTEVTGGRVTKVIPDGTTNTVATGLLNPMIAGPGLVGSTFYLEANSQLGDGLVVKVDINENTSDYLGQLVNPVSMDWEDSMVLFVAEGAPTNRIVKYSRVSNTRTELAVLAGEPHSIAFTPIR